MVRTVVNANVKDQTDQMDAFRSDADTTMLRAQLRVAAVEADIARLNAAQGGAPPGIAPAAAVADTSVAQRIETIEAELLALSKGFDAEVDKTVTRRLNTELEPKLKKLVSDGVDSELAKTNAVINAHGDALERQRVSGQEIQDRVQVMIAQIESISAIVSTSAAMRQPPTASTAQTPAGAQPASSAQPSSSPPWDGWKASADARGMPMPGAQGPATFNIGSPAPTPATGARYGGDGPSARPTPPGMPAGLRGEDFGTLTLQSRVFEEKTAREPMYRYDGVPEHGGHAWRSDTSDYFIAKCPGSAQATDFPSRICCAPTSNVGPGRTPAGR